MSAIEQYQGELRTDLTINLSDLHHDWQKQPTIYEKWGGRLSIALEERDNVKTNLDLTKAELDMEVRNSPEEYGLERVTEGAVNAAILQEHKFKKAQKRLAKKQSSVEYLKQALIAINQKKSALEAEVRLYLGAYFSEPVAGNPDFDVEMDQRLTEQSRPTGLRRRRRRTATG